MKILILLLLSGACYGQKISALNDTLALSVVSGWWSQTQNIYRDTIWGVHFERRTPTHVVDTFGDKLDTAFVYDHEEWLMFEELPRQKEICYKKLSKLLSHKRRNPKTITEIADAYNYELDQAYAIASAQGDFYYVQGQIDALREKYFGHK